MTVEPIVADGFAELLDYFDRVPRIANKAQLLAINSVASRGGLTKIKDAMQDQVAFPRSYLGGDKLKVRKAYSGHMEAVISARQRPTSLARFAKGASAAGNRRGGVSVMVKPGSTKRMPNAFLMRLRSGASLTDDNYNIGLAIRLKPGDRVFNKKQQSAVQLSHNLYLLYAPSVDQVFRSVAAEKAPEIGEDVATEFLRQFTRLEQAEGF